MRVGQGIDVHRFSQSPGRVLMLGGVEIADAEGLEGHSDADVVLHALVDALLGAAALGDLGSRFGTDQPAYAGAPSSVFLAEASLLLREAGWAVANVDCTIVAERPRIAPHRPAIIDRLACLLGLPASAVSVKATTTDGLGLTGRGEGIACFATALILPADPSVEIETVEGRPLATASTDAPTLTVGEVRQLLERHRR